VSIGPREISKKIRFLRKNVHAARTVKISNAPLSLVAVSEHV